MKIWKNIDPRNIVLNAPLKQKKAVLQFIADRFAANGVVRNTSGFLAGLLQREEVMSTGIGGGIAIPHATSPDVAEGVVLLVRLDRAIDFEAIDGHPVDLVLALALPAEDTAVHLQLLAGISRLCQSPDFLDTVRRAPDPQELLTTIRALEEAIPFH